MQKILTFKLDIENTKNHYGDCTNEIDINRIGSYVIQG